MRLDRLTFIALKAWLAERGEADPCRNFWGSHGWHLQKLREMNAERMASPETDLPDIAAT